jgi:hypothetical protein
MAMRSSRVSSRKRAIRPAFAAAASPSSTEGSGSVPMTVISSRSTSNSGGPVNQPSGSRPANQPATSLRSTGGADSMPRPRPQGPRPRPLPKPEPKPAAAAAAGRSRGGLGEAVVVVMFVHGDLRVSVVITRLHGNTVTIAQEDASAALRADTSVTGAEQTNPWHT